MQTKATSTNPLASFILPHGYIDPQGKIHREGEMRLATAADEIFPLKDPRVQNNPAYFKVIVFSRVIIRLGTIEMITTGIIDKLDVDDINYLTHLYNNINETSIK